MRRFLLYTALRDALTWFGFPQHKAYLWAAWFCDEIEANEDGCREINSSGGGMNLLTRSTLHGCPSCHCADTITLPDPKARAHDGHLNGCAIWDAPPSECDCSPHSQ